MPKLRNPLRLIVALILAAGLLPLGPVALAFQGATPAASPVATPVGASDVYSDPSGAFTVPIPTNWVVEPQDGFVRLTAPEGSIAVSIAVVPDADLEAAISDAWELVAEAEPEADEDALQEVPTGQGVDRRIVITYDEGLESGQVVQALGQLVGETSYVTLIEGELGAISRRQSQLQVILTGLEISAVERVDLAGVAPETLTPEMLADLETYIEETRERFGVPGIAVAIVQNGEVVYRQGFGAREMGGDAPVTPETLMMIGSTTKPMTTMMMATLVDDGLLEWDTPVVEILPSFAVADPEITQQLTVRDLVCACTGVPRRDLELAFNAANLDAAAVIASLATFEFFTPIGEAFQYSNQMVAAGGYIATLAAGGNLDTLRGDYIALMEARVIEPIGMPNTVFSIAEAVAEPNHAVPHPYQLDGSLAAADPELESILDPVLPAGGSVWSNVDDMARFVMTMLNEGISPDGERVVSAENLAETWEPQVPVSAETSYGLGWFIDEYKGQPVIHHGGNTLGFTSDLAFMPEADLGIVTLVNAQAANIFTNAVRVRLFELAFEQEPEMEESLAFAIEQQEELFTEGANWIGPAPERDAVAPYLGAYVSPALGQISLRYEDGRLLLDAGEFVAEVRTSAGEIANVSDYILVDSSMAGLIFTFRDEDGAPLLELVDPTGTGNYVFTAVGATATPVATPVP